jgi:hypothetical protein
MRQEVFSYFIEMPVLLFPAISYALCHGIDENPGQGLITGAKKDTGDNTRR